MTVQIRRYTAPLARMWDEYVRERSSGHLFLQSGWGPVIQATYGHPCFFLLFRGSSGRIEGILPLVHIKSLVFGNRLVSLPFFDRSGLMADGPVAEEALLGAALALARERNIPEMELRQGWEVTNIPEPQKWTLQTHKVRMVRALPDSSEALMKSFRSKLRSQIRKPVKEGLFFRIGSIEFLADFYRVFVRNMRDLGSPVHSPNLFSQIVHWFPEQTRFVLVYGAGGIPMAGSVVMGFGNTLCNPWASALREFSRFSPNMLLYWAMLSYACDKGYRFFDFGRSTPNEGTYRFKKQWGAEAEPLVWYKCRLDGRTRSQEIHGSSGLDRAVEVWKRMPISVTRLLGPRIRGQIDL